MNILSIRSDYSLPRPGDQVALCEPGTCGYKEDYPVWLEGHLDVTSGRRWTKSMNNPTWVRREGPNTPPVAMADRFTAWLYCNLVRGPVVLAGLTLDCCVLATAMELNHRGYDVKILLPATDTYCGSLDAKTAVSQVVSNWATCIGFDDFIGLCYRMSHIHKTE